MYIYIYIYMYILWYIHIYIYICTCMVYIKSWRPTFYSDTHENHFGSQYQPSYDKSHITENSNPVALNAMTGIEGLDRAYARDKGSYSGNHTMLVSGTKDFPQDHWDDLKIPCNLTAESLRYRNSDKAWQRNEALYTNQQITSLVGYSLGGAVILELQQQHPSSILKLQHMTHP